MHLVRISATSAKTGTTISILNAIRTGSHAYAARRMIECAIQLEQIEKSYASRFGKGLPEKFVERYRFERNRAFPGGDPYVDEIN